LSSREGKPREGKGQEQNNSSTIQHQVKERILHSPVERKPELSRGKTKAHIKEASLGKQEGMRNGEARNQLKRPYEDIGYDYLSLEKNL